MPECFGTATPDAQACCELAAPLVPAYNDQLAGMKKLVVAGAMKAGTSLLYKALSLEARATVVSACYGQW